MNDEVLDALRKEVVDAIYGQSDWLESMVVGLPAGVDADEWTRVVEMMLADLQLDAVDVTIDESVRKAPWLRSFELKPGWA